MIQEKIIYELNKNKKVFEALLFSCKKEEYLWKPSPDKWCLLEIVCHLYDEEREDFRARVKHVLDTPDIPASGIDPTRWVKERKYIEQNYEKKLADFFEEREQSIVWLQSLKNPKWDNTYHHPKLGAMSANLFLSNWLAHDYLHMKQIIKLKFDYLKSFSGETLSYAGEWQ